MTVINLIKPLFVNRRIRIPEKEVNRFSSNNELIELEIIDVFGARNGTQIGLLLDYSGEAA